MATKNKKIIFKFQQGIGIRLIIYGLLILIFALLTVFFFLKATNYVEYNQLFYTETSSLDYSVCLKPNSYFPDRCQVQGKQYIANIIDYVDANFQYKFNTSNIVDYNYKYYIKAEIVANEKGEKSKVLYNTEEILVPEKNGSNQNNFLFIEEKLKIDYDKYNLLMTAFRKDYTLLLDSRIIITLHVEIDGKYDKINEPIKSSQDMVLTIPLSEQTLEITMDYQSINNSELINVEVINESVTNVLYGICILCILVVIFSLIQLIMIFLKINSEKSLYVKTLNKIMKEYNHVIVEAKNMPIINDMKVYELDNFEDLLDARETILKPIVYLRINSQISWFMIPNGNEMYRFILKESDLEKNDNKSSRKKVEILKQLDIENLETTEINLDNINKEIENEVVDEKTLVDLTIVQDKLEDASKIEKKFQKINDILNNKNEDETKEADSLYDTKEISNLLASIVAEKEKSKIDEIKTKQDKKKNKLINTSVFSVISADLTEFEKQRDKKE